MKSARIATAMLALYVTAAGAAAGDLSPSQSATVLGPGNQLLMDGSSALEAGRYEEGVRLTLAGLDQPNNPHDEAAAHTNICAGYAALKRWKDALDHCNRALELEPGNWRTYNNRAAVFTGLGLFELAIADVNKGLTLAPGSDTLQKSLEVVNRHREAQARDRWRRPNKA